jgi:CRP-like cAMP-binding protein
MATHPTPRDRRYEPGDVIIAEGTTAISLFILRRGRVKVVKRNADGDDQRIDILGPGSIFGEMALIDQQNRSASVIAIERCACVEIPRGLLEEQLAKSGPWVGAILRIMTLRLRLTTDHLLAQQRIRGYDGTQTSSEIPFDPETERHLKRVVTDIEAQLGPSDPPTPKISRR